MGSGEQEREQSCNRALGRAALRTATLAPPPPIAASPNDPRLPSLQVIMALGDFMSVQAHACIGGKSVGEDLRRLEAGVHAVSGTPGRVFDMINRCAFYC